MKVGGFQKTSLIDFPDEISSIIWTIGCNFKCPFCYNKNLVEGKLKEISEDEIFLYLKKRQGLVDGVAITGGEPLIQKDIIDFIKKIKSLNYLVKLDTNGTNPEKLKELIDKKLIDYVSMDIKAPKEKYKKLAGTDVDIKKIEKSINFLKNSKIEYEFRTTFVPDLLKKEDVLEIAKWLKGSKKFYLQQFKINPPLLSSKIEKLKPYQKEYLFETIEEIKPYFDFCNVRGI